MNRLIIPLMAVLIITLGSGICYASAGKSTPTITWSNPADIIYGTALNSTQLNASASVPGTFVYNPPTGTVLGAGTRILHVDFTPTDTANYYNASKDVTLNVQKSTPTISWTAPSPITYGTALSGTQLDATSSIPGNLVYNPASGTILGAGTKTLNVTFTPNDSTNYTTATGSVSLSINQAIPTISWTQPDAITYGTALSSTQLSATCPTTAGSFAYNPVSGTVMGAGTKTLNVTFTPNDSTNYSTASKDVSITVQKETPTITWSNPADIIYETALNSTQLNASASVAGTFDYAPISGTVLSAGAQTLHVDFTPNDTANYSTTSKNVTINITVATPEITWNNPADIVYGTLLNSTQLNASASIPGTFTYNPVSGTVLSADTQTLRADFTPTDTANYSGTSKNVTINVTSAIPTISWTQPDAITYGTALNSTQLNATCPTTSGTFAYNPASGTLLEAGTKILNVTFTPTDSTNYTTANGSVSLTANQATPTITWSKPADIVYGTALNSTQLNASASVPGTFVYNPPAGTVLGAGTQTLHVDFTPNDAANYSTTTNNVTINVIQANPVITWSNPSDIIYGTALNSTQLNASASVPGPFVYNPVSGTVLSAGTQTLRADFTPTDTANYSGTSKNVTINVTSATPTITWTQPADIVYGTALNSTQLNAFASVPGALVYSPTNGIVLSAGTQTLHVDFTPEDTANYSNASKNVTVNVSEQPVLPAANFSINVTGGYAPLSVQFNDISENATLWSWDFDNNGIVDSTDKNPVHTYDAPGTYTVNLTASNENGTDSKLDTINVSKQRVLPAYAIDKTIIDVAGKGPAGNVTKAGDVIAFYVNVTNDGNIDLTNITVNDFLVNLTGPVESQNADGILEVGEKWTYTGNYTVTKADINSNGGIDGFINSTSTVSSDQLEPKSASAEVPVEWDPNYSIFKSVIGSDENGDCIINSPGDIIKYRVVVKNDGNVDLDNVSINDPLINLTGPTGDDIDPGVLNPGEVWVYTGNYSVTKDDIDNGSSGKINNTATVSSNELQNKSSTVSQPIAKNADFSIYKSIIGLDEAGDYIINQPGDIIRYQIAVKNNGDVDLHNVNVTDSLINNLTGPTGDIVDTGVLNPGETWIYYVDYTVTQLDIDNNGDGKGLIMNTATFSCDEHASESSSMELPIFLTANTGTDTNSGSENKSAKVLPVANFSTNITSGYVPLSVQFTDLSQNATTRIWDFNNDGIADSSDGSPFYTYTAPGIYTANLTVSNANGTASKNAIISVLQVTSSSSSNSGSSYGSNSAVIASSSAVSSSTGKTNATETVIQPENNTQDLEQNNGKTANVEQTPEQKNNTNNPAKESKRTPGFGIICEITTLLAVFLYKRK